MKIAKENNLNLISIDINLNKIDEKTIISNMLFDFHFSILHFEGLKKIKKIFLEKISISFAVKVLIVFFHMVLQQALLHISFQE